MRKIKRFIITFFIIIFLISPFYLNRNWNFSNINFELKEEILEEKNSLKYSDIAGTDLYAEQIRAYVAGNKSIIKQSLFTNDTNIFTQFDINDPAFYKCNVLISASNAMHPDIFPIPLTETVISNQFTSGFNRFVGFLYYDDELSQNDADSRAERALEIIRRKFQIDLILVESLESNFYPFIGDYPNWEIMLNELTTNLPMDGYWKALNLSRLSSELYYKNHHLTSTFMILNSLEFFEGDFEISTSQLDFNIDTLDLTFLQNIETEELVNQIDNIIENYGEILNATISEDELEQFIKFLGSFTLSNDSHYTTLVIQYEGLPEGISNTGKNQYKFDLWDAIGYQGEPLEPSEKIYIALIGAFMTDIEINILCTEIVDFTPMNFKFYDYLLEQIGLIFYLAGIEFNVEALKEYSFDLFWVNKEGFKCSYVKPVNLNDSSDLVNFLQQLGFKGFSSIPTGLLNPFEDFTITYNLSNSEPNLLIRKEIVGENASYGVFRDFSYYISAENVGNITAWGYPTPIPLELNDFFLILTLGSQTLADEFKNTLWDVIRIEYPSEYDSLEDFFNFDEDPLIFYFDSLGTGIYDTFFPDILNFTNLWPYNDKMEEVIDIIVIGYPQLITALGVLGITTEELKDTFTNDYSIWNEDNWKLEPGNIFSYFLDNISIANLDSFTPFYMNNFTISTNPPTPEVIYGTSLNGTNPEMALLTDNKSWDIESVESFLNQKIELNFIFQNDTFLDLGEKPLELVSIIMNFSTSNDLDSIDFEIFNFKTEEFEDMNPYLDSIENNSWTFSFINNNESLDWLFYPAERENHTMLFKLRCINSNEFNISIDNLDVEFSTRNININEDSGSRVVYSSRLGNIQFERRSNSIPLSTFDMASLILYSSLDNYSLKVGDLNNFYLYLKNIGSRTAKNITISMEIPGIINNTNGFTLKDSNLTYYIPEMAPYEEITINFSFYVPNTRSLSEISVTYHNPENVQSSNSSRIISLTNEVYISAPLDYIKKFPFVRLIKISSNLNNIFLNQPIFNLTFILKIVNPFGIETSDLNISINEQIGDLIRVDFNDYNFQDIKYNEILSFNITLNKIGFNSYYYPPINFIESTEGKTIQILSSESSILGEINFTIIKYVNKEHIRVGDEISVFIEVRNTGNIDAGNIILNDELSYSQSDFSLLSGKLVNSIESIEPGEIVTINYTIKAKGQNILTLKPAFINYYFLHELIEISNDVLIKINARPLDQLLYVLFPTIGGVFIVSIYFLEYSKYKRKKNRKKRREKQVFELTSRESILRKKTTFRDQLRLLSKSTKIKRDD